MGNVQKTLAQKMADQIIDYIAANGLKPGDKLPTEKKLTALMCVSRGVVREALSILATMHIIRLVHGSGIYIDSPQNAVMLTSYQTYLHLGYANIDEMYELRIQMEGVAAELTAKRISQSGIYELEMYVEQSKQYIFDEKQFCQVDDCFHHVISSQCQNRLLIMNLRSISEIVSQYRSVTIHYLDIRKSAYEYHVKLYEAIRDHNPSAARMYMVEHLTEVKRAADFYHLFRNQEDFS